MAWQQHHVTNQKLVSRSIAQHIANATVCCRGGAFNVAVRELLNYYVAMEEFVMEEDVHKAISIREHPAGGLTSSMVRASLPAQKRPS